VRRFCELIDPSCPQYNSGYRDVIVREARREIADTDASLQSNPRLASGRPIVDSRGAIAVVADCCGGGMPPGIFDGAELDEPAQAPPVLIQN
jgi:hypothetical protein